MVFAGRQGGDDIEEEPQVSVTEEGMSLLRGMTDRSADAVGTIDRDRRAGDVELQEAGGWDRGSPSTPVPGGGTNVGWKDSNGFKWLQVVAGFMCMVAIANVQFAWTLLVPGLVSRLDASQAKVQVAFSVFAIIETVSMPFAGYVSDKYGARRTVLPGGVLVALGWIWTGVCSTIGELYCAYAVAGVGVGTVYAASIGLGLKWFPHRRGLAAGIVVSGYGAGTVATLVPFQHMIDARGVEETLIVWGIAQGATVLLCGIAMENPPSPHSRDEIVADVLNSDVDAETIKIPTLPTISSGLNTWQAMRTPSFWLIWCLFFLLGITGLMVTVQIKPIADTFGLSHERVMGTAPAVVAIYSERIFFGLSKPAFGFISDRLGREKTVAMACFVQCGGIIIWSLCLTNAYAFALLVGPAYCAYGEMYSLIPALTADVFGHEHATANYGVIYGAKGFASVFSGPVAAAIRESTGWYPIVYATSILSGIAGLMTIMVLRPAVQQFKAKRATVAHSTARDDDAKCS